MRSERDREIAKFVLLSEPDQSQLQKNASDVRKEAQQKFASKSTRLVTCYYSNLHNQSGHFTPGDEVNSDK